MTQNTLTNQYEGRLQQQIIKLCHKMRLSLHDNHFGSKVYTNYQRVALIVLFMRSRKALRDFTSELYESKWVSWLDLKELPNFSTISRWIKKWNLSWIRNALNIIIEKEQPSLMAVDATGFDSWQRSRHYEKRIGASHMPYAKVDLLVDTETKIIYDFVLRTKPRHDVLGASTMIKRLKKKNVLILADKGYDSESLHEVVVNSGNKMFAPVRDFKVKKPKGKNRKRCSLGHKKYHQRNIVESINFSLKSRFRFLRNKLHYMKKREFGWKIITYNLEKLSKRVNSLFKHLIKLIICNRATKTKDLNNIMHYIAPIEVII